jgi:hypothetical protein
LREELTLAERAVEVGNALMSSPEQALVSITSTLTHAQALLSRPIHHTTVDEREEIKKRVNSILKAPGDVDSGVVGASLSQVSNHFFGSVQTTSCF